LHLKAHKGDGSSGLSTDHIIHAGDDCLIHIACLFTSIVVHGTVPDSCLVSTILPIPKGRNVNTSDSSNYRGIALSSVYGKLFDNIVLNRYSVKLMTSELQFGFKAKSSTNMCTMVLKEAIAYYSKNQSSVFCTFLDASKAFDRVRYCKLFDLLIKRNLPACIIRVLVNFYTSNYVRVSWCGVMSDYFHALNGVKQGGVLSPVLFCIYIDNLLVALSKAGVGCFIGNNFVGALAYADDIVLLAPSATALRKMLQICDEFATDYSIVFNAQKSKCLVIFPQRCRFLTDRLNACTFYIGCDRIEFVELFSHLGHIINAKLDDVSDIIKRRNDFIRQVNNILCYFKNLNSFVKYQLFSSYGLSMYGCELWLLNSSSISDFEVA
jgi:Reverse transcriptase (RNA-dependent DNA polymerase)